MSDEAASAAPKTTGDQINLRVVSAEGAELFFRIKKTTPFKKLFHAYCQKQGVPPASVRFLFDGKRIEEGDTPAKLSMEDDDLIDALVEQVGGRCA